jgi:transcriptional regulator with XRE-family HTH domain
MARQRHPLYYARHRRKLTIQQLAERAGLSLGGISRVENRLITNPHRLTRQALADALGYEVSDLWPPEGRLPHPDLRPPQARAGANGGRTRSRRRAGR